MIDLGLGTQDKKILKGHPPIVVYYHVYNVYSENHPFVRGLSGDEVVGAKLKHPKVRNKTMRPNDFESRRLGTQPTGQEEETERERERGGVSFIVRSFSSAVPLSSEEGAT